MQVEEIKRMQCSRQHLLNPAAPVQVVQNLCGLQAQFLSNAVHALKIRSHTFERLPEGLAKSWTIRGTMHLFALDDLPLMLHEGRERRLRPCDTLDAEEGVSAERKAHFAQVILEEIAHGAEEREQLKERCFQHGMTETEEQSLFNAWGGLIRAMCEAGWICHRPQEKKAFMLCPAFEPTPKMEAETELARRYFAHYGPATVRDAAYFFGVSQTKIKMWMQKLPLLSGVCGGETYYWCELQDEPFHEDLPKCVFLSGFDPLMLGYEKTQNLYLPRQALRCIFSLAGMVSPALLLHGMVAARWKKKGGKIWLTPFETLHAAEIRLVEESAANLWPDFVQLALLEE